jgi:Tfp pilus assembly protein PilO
MLTTRTARWSAVTGLVCVIVLVATWFVLVGPRRSDAAEFDDQRAQAEATNVSLQAQIALLERQSADLPARRAELAKIRSELPAAADVADLVRSLSGLAEDAGVDLTSVTPGTATTLTPAAGTNPAVVSIPVTLEVHGRYVENALFLRYVQTKLKRVFLLTEVTAARGSGESTSSTSATTTASVTTSPTTPTPSATASATATSTPTSTGTTAPSLADDFDLQVAGEVFALVDAVTASPGASATASPTTAP